MARTKKTARKVEVPFQGAPSKPKVNEHTKSKLDEQSKSNVDEKNKSRSKVPFGKAKVPTRDPNSQMPGVVTLGRRLQLVDQIGFDPLPADNQPVQPVRHDPAMWYQACRMAFEYVYLDRLPGNPHACISSDLSLDPSQSVGDEPAIPSTSRETNANLEIYAAPYPDPNSQMLGVSTPGRRPVDESGNDPVHPALALSTSASRPSASFLRNDLHAGPASQQRSVSSPNQMQAQYLTQGRGSRIEDRERNMRYRP
ncbi:hypothetical protein L7F22_004788 [Adiantum nelumboides]|nr:hypothetical protein [Adiantum nelumboides]